MPQLADRVRLSRKQVAWFRLCRSGLVTPFESAEAAAEDLIGIQAQFPSPAALALWNRTNGLSLENLNDLLFGKRVLIKLWGQRNTLHLYPSHDWPVLHSAMQVTKSWLEQRMEKEGRDLGRLTEATESVAQRMRHGGVLSWKGMMAMVPDLYEWMPQGYGFAMDLVRRGLACHAAPVGSEARFAHREVWLPSLDWKPPSPEMANLELARRYLHAYGPATTHDLAYWRGVSIPSASRWIAALRTELTEVELDGESHYVLSTDLEDVTAKPPAVDTWPIRLLYRFDPLLLGLRSKTWLVADDYYKRVWRPGGHVEGVLLVRDRVAGTWRYDRTLRGIKVTLRPFSALAKSVRGDLERQASGVADFFDLPLLRCNIQQ